MDETIAVSFDAKPFEDWLAEFSRSTKSLPQGVLQLLNAFLDCLFQVPGKFFAIEQSPAAGALVLALKPTDRALELLAAIRAFQVD